MSARIFPVILAGGASSRLWPASGRDKPKWDLRLSGGSDGKPAQSLLEGAWERARALAPAADCFVVSGGAQAQRARESLAELPVENLLIEPEPRDTSGAVAFAAGAIFSRIGKTPPASAVMLVLPGDQIIQPVARFAECASAGAALAVEAGTLVTFGIVPRKPATGYGYVHRGPELSLKEAGHGKTRLFKVLGFKEKPDRKTAEEYVTSGEFYWNGGIFLWQLSALLAEMERQIPAHAAFIRAFGAGGAWTEVLRAQFSTLKKISIDYGIMEQARSVSTVAADFQWDDIGSWSSIAEHVPAKDGNSVSPGTQVISVDAQANVVFAPGKRVALVGVSGLAVVESDGQILVCRLERDQDVKKVSEQLK